MAFIITDIALLSFHCHLRHYHITHYYYYAIYAIIINTVYAIIITITGCYCITLYYASHIRHIMLRWLAIIIIIVTAAAVIIITPHYCQLLRH